jgi:hypothetical protein
MGRRGKEILVTCMKKEFFAGRHVTAMVHPGGANSRNVHFPNYKQYYKKLPENDQLLIFGKHVKIRKSQTNSEIETWNNEFFC